MSAKRIDNVIVTVGLNEVIENDLEGFLDLLEELVFAGQPESAAVLCQQEYQVVGVTAEGDLRICVSADIFNDGEDDE